MMGCLGLGNAQRGEDVMTKLLHADMTSQIIGVYSTVYNRLSQTYPEYIFRRPWCCC